VRAVHPARILRRAPRPARRATQQETKPVQGELSLERVKVVRNDLSDADLEVVRVRASAPAATAGVEQTVNGQNAWGRLATRVFGTD
jgi:hypothetical protein